MTITTLLGLDIWSANQNSPEVPVNEGIAVSLLLELACKSKGTSTPPGSPAEGDAHIIGASPTGAWSTFSEDNIAYYHNGAWRELTARDRLTVFVADGATSVTLWRYDASGGAWVEISLDTFLSLTDTPASYSGAAGLAVLVNSAEDGLEFGSVGGGGGAAPTRSAVALSGSATDISIPAGCTYFRFHVRDATLSTATANMQAEILHTSGTVIRTFSGAARFSDAGWASPSGSNQISASSTGSDAAKRMYGSVWSPRDSGKRTMTDVHGVSPASGGEDHRWLTADAAGDDDTLRIKVTAGTFSAGTVEVEWFYN